jgi:hypothetical protein
VTRLYSTSISYAVILAVAGCGHPSADQRDASTAGSDAAAPYRCDLAECRNGFARTCDQQPLTLDCTSFGGACADFVNATNTAYSWCSCGSIAEGQGQCLDSRNGITCASGLGLPVQCSAGTVCTPSPSDLYGLACECDDFADGVCPDAVCVGDPDCSACTPSCAGKQCGDNGCGGQCGRCAFGDTCTAGQCTLLCVPDCSGKQCGDDGCGGSCGTCSGTCTSAGQCQGTCVPSCTNKTCGSDGCSGSCGTCTAGLTCQSAGICDCTDFFAEVHYSFTLDLNATWPSSFTSVALNVWHIDVNGNPNSNDGAFLRLSDPSFTFAAYGCQPDIRIVRDYALSGIACHSDQTISGRTSFVIPPPIINSDGSCTAPDL